MSRRIKEALHINCRKPNLNAQQNHLALAISLQLLSPFPFSVFVCLFIVVVFCVSFSSTVFLISDTNYRYFYCLSYTLLLLHLITAHFVSHLSLSTISFIISMLIIVIFYCLSYTSLLLHVFITHLAIDFIVTM